MVSKIFLTASRDEFLPKTFQHMWQNSLALCFMRLVLAQVFDTYAVGFKVPSYVSCTIKLQLRECDHHNVIPCCLDWFFFVLSSQSANAFSSGSRKVELTAGGKRYTTKIAAVMFFLLGLIYLFIIVGCSIQDVRKCSICYFRYLKCEVNIFYWMLTYSADQTLEIKTYVNTGKLCTWNRLV